MLWLVVRGHAVFERRPAHLPSSGGVEQVLHDGSAVVRLKNGACGKGAIATAAVVILFRCSSQQPPSSVQLLLNRVR